METLEERIRRAVREDVEVVPYDPSWPRMFLEEREHLLSCLPTGLLGRIEHFGSTAVPGLAAKPIVDMLIEVRSLDSAVPVVVPVLTSQGYDYFWRPTWGDDTPPFYAWFIKRDADGRRTHHLHVVEPQFEHWDRLLFRDYLRRHPDTAAEYGRLKLRLAAGHPNDRVAYTEGKTRFIGSVMELARAEARDGGHGGADHGCVRAGVAGGLTRSGEACFIRGPREQPGTADKEN